MARLGDVMWAGQSGQQYRFQTWSFDTRFRPVGAVFLVTKRVFTNVNKTYRRANHEILRAGHTASLSLPLASPEELESLEKSGANCVCVFQSPDEAHRLAVLEDLHPAFGRSLRKL